MIEIVQGSPEWHALRLGKVTASRVADIVAKTKTGWSASRANYLAELICERLTGAQQERFTNVAMQWGVENEPLARKAYEFMTDNAVTLIGFVDHPRISMSGASPDGLIADAGLVEIKCPNTATHIDTLLTQTVPGKYITQMHWQMACTGRTWCDFVSFDPRMPEEMRLFVKRITRDDATVKDLEAAVCAFLAEVELTIDQLQRAYAEAA